MSTPYAILNIVAGITSVAAIALYNVWFAHMVVTQPESTVLGLTSVSRNWVMASSLLGSTSIVIIFGFVTFLTNVTVTGKGPPLDNPTGIAPEVGFEFDFLFSLKTQKVILILIIYMASFFCFAQAIRFFNHVALIININLSEDQITLLNSDGKANYRPLPQSCVADIMNRGAMFHHIGLRAYYVSFPLFAYLWGPWYLILATIVLLYILRHIDFNTMPWTRLIFNGVTSSSPPPNTPAMVEAGTAVPLEPVITSEASPVPGSVVPGTGMGWRTASAERRIAGPYTAAVVAAMEGQDRLLAQHADD
ncbi:hypothetical protein HK101_001323 [Irineochytrium annulatum]|nr:hypothetical protein HK101_001323 [Irineochytrium annulatum]